MTEQLEWTVKCDDRAVCVPLQKGIDVGLAFVVLRHCRGLGQEEESQV